MIHILFIAFIAFLSILGICLLVFGSVIVGASIVFNDAIKAGVAKKDDECGFKWIKQSKTNDCKNRKGKKGTKKRVKK